MAVDPYPVFPEFGYGATTCRGTMTGCAVCATGSVLRAFGKSIPLTTDPRDGDLVLDARSLGRSMGARHRAVDSSVRHGLSLSGYCLGGTNWCAYCAMLELRARGLPATYARPTDSELLAWLKAGYPVIIPGLYSRVPIVPVASYSRTTPAHGRSDDDFGSWHMVTAFKVNLSPAGTPVSVVIADADFGSASRPVVPPHSLWSWGVFLSYYHATGSSPASRWGVCVVKRKPSFAVPTAPRYRVVITGRTTLYSGINGTDLGDVTLATYICTRSKVDGLWWYSIASGKRLGQAFKPNRHVKAVLV